MDMQQCVPLHFYRATKYSVLLLKIIRVKRYECVSVCLCSCLSYPACNAHSFPRRFIQYCHPWPVWLYRIFPHYLTNGTNFVLMSQNLKCVFWFSLELSSETFLIIKIIQRLTIHLHRSSCKVPVILVGFLIKLEISQQVFEKSSNIKFHENRSCGSRVDPCGQTRRN